MNLKVFMIAVMLAILPDAANAEEKNLADQVAEARDVLQQEQALNSGLKGKLAEKEKVIAELKDRAKTLDEQIAAFKEEHGIEEDA